MDWLTISTVATSDNWVFTPSVTSTLFKFNHISNSSIGNKLKVIVRQAFNDGTDLHLFDYRLINASLDKSILFIDKPKELITRTLAIKRADTFLNEPWTIEIQTLINNAVIDMPSYPSLPIYSGITNTISATTISVSNTASVTLSVANPNKIGTSIINNSTKSKLYISLGVAATLTVYDKILGIGEVFETPFNWSGDIFGIWDKADATGNAKVKDFS